MPKKKEEENSIEAYKKIEKYSIKKNDKGEYYSDFKIN
jgi:hypothetical protein